MFVVLNMVFKGYSIVPSKFTRIDEMSKLLVSILMTPPHPHLRPK